MNINHDNNYNFKNKTKIQNRALQYEESILVYSLIKKRLENQKQTPNKSN